MKALQARAKPSFPWDGYEDSPSSALGPAPASGVVAVGAKALVGCATSSRELGPPTPPHNIDDLGAVRMCMRAKTTSYCRREITLRACLWASGESTTPILPVTAAREKVTTMAKMARYLLRSWQAHTTFALLQKFHRQTLTSSRLPPPYLSQMIHSSSLGSGLT
jgi:hypothetical protein